MDECEDLRRWVHNWEETAPLLEEIRRREIREPDTHQVLANLEGAFNYAIRALPPRRSSGLVEMRRLLDKAHKQSVRMRWCFG